MICPRLKLHVVWREFVRQPRHAVRRVVKHACGDPGLFDHAVAVKQGGDPAQIQLVGFNRAAAEDHARVGGVIGDGVEHLARALGFRVNVMAAGVDQLRGRG